MESIASGQSGLSDATRPELQTIDVDSGISTNIQQMADPRNLTAQQVISGTIGGSGPGTAATAQTPDAVAAQTIDAFLLGQAPQVEAAQGQVSVEAEAAQATGDISIDAAQIDDDTMRSVLAQNVQGGLSPEALADVVQGKASRFEGDIPTADVLSRAAATISGATTGQASSVDTGGLPSLGDIDLMPDDIVAEVAELPPEALVTTQLNTLLEGMEEGKTPAWALPAVQAVEQQLAARGMSASTVGRDALFAAIVQSSIPLAQSNADAIRERANQNLANRQQAALQSSAQKFQAGLTQFQTVADIQTVNAQLAQQMELANMSAENQVKLANLQALNDASRDNLNAAQQTELANLQAELQVGTLNAQLANAMGVANLNAAQQTAIANAATVANFDMTKFTQEQQVALANSQLMATMTLKNADNAQQAVLQEATLKANQDIANADMRTKASIENARNFLSMDMANLNNEQQALVVNQQAQQQFLLSNQAAENAARQFNATSQMQTDQFMANMAATMNQFNTNQINAMTQFNIAEENKIEAQNVANANQTAQFNAQLKTTVDQFNVQNDMAVDQWNKANAQAVEQSNITWRRQANTADTAAQNAINQQNALNAFNLEKGALDALWQEVRDQASYDQQNWANYQAQVTNLYATAMSHEGYAAKNNWQQVETLTASIRGIFEG